MVGFLRMRLPSHLSFNPAEQSCKRPKENGVELGERVYPISQVGSLNFRHSWFVDPLVSWPERKRIGEARPIALRRRNELCKWKREGGPVSRTLLHTFMHDGVKGIQGSSVHRCNSSPLRGARVWGRRRRKEGRKEGGGGEMVLYSSHSSCKLLVFLCSLRNFALLC